MVLVRRQYFIEEDQDAAISEIAKALGMDKSEIVQIALRVGLPDIKAMSTERLVDLVEERLQVLRLESIKKPSAKRRAK